MEEATDIYYSRLFEGPFLYTYSIGLCILGQMIVNTIQDFCFELHMIVIEFFLQNNFSVGFAYAACNYVLLVIFCRIGENVKQAVS